MASAAVVVVTSGAAVRLDTAAGSDNVAGKSVIINTDQNIALGGSTVAAGTGLVLAATDAPLTVELGDNEGGLYAIAASTTANVQVLRVG